MTCVFCSIVKGEIPAHIVLDRDRVMAFLDINPVAPGHTLVIPKEHYENILEVPKDVLAELMEAVKAVSKALINYGYEGVNVLSNVGPAAGQVIMHAHIHVIPRKSGDELFKRPKTQRASDEELSKIAQELRRLI